MVNRRSLASGARCTSARVRNSAAARSTASAAAPWPWAAAHAITASRGANVFCFSVNPAAPASSPLTTPQIRDLGCARRPAGERLELAGAEAVLGRPGAHDLLPRRGVDPVALALARVVRDRLTPRAPHLDAGR